MHNFDKPFRLGLYEKALPNSLDWEEKNPDGKGAWL